MRDPSRREFLKSSITAACAAGVSAGLPASMFAASADSAAPPIKKGVLLDMLPKQLNNADRFKMVRDVGFEVVQAPTTADEHAAEEIKKAAEAASIRIDSVMNMEAASAAFLISSAAC